MDAIITIIIPCYNAGEYIDRAMQAVVEQTLGMEHMSIILVDDASTDDTFARMISWQTKYPYQIQIIHNAKNRRQGACRNLGLQSAKSKYVAFLDADDWIEPDMYEKMIEVSEYGECDVVQCANSNDDHERYWETLEEKYTGKMDRLVSIDTDEERSRMIASNLLGTYVVTKVYNRAFLLEHEMHFPEGLLFEDIYWMGLLYCYATKIGFVEQRLYHYYMNPTSVSRVRNQAQNRDICEVNRHLWRTYEKRGLLKTNFAKALEYEILCTYYLTTAKMVFLRYDVIPYDMFYEAQRDVLEMVPDFANNPFISDYTTQFNILLLGLLDKKLSEGEIDWAANSMRILAHSDMANLNAVVDNFV